MLKGEDLIKENILESISSKANYNNSLEKCQNAVVDQINAKVLNNSKQESISDHDMTSVNQYVQYRKINESQITN